MQAQTLARFLSRLIEELRSDCDVSALSCIEDQLGDALCIARWLWENIYLDMDWSQAVDLLEALVVRLDEETWSDADLSTLTAVVDQLRSGLQDSLIQTDQSAGKLSEAESESRLALT
jgi:hypothetical protein